MDLETRKKTAEKIFIELEMLLSNLYMRWSDEREYEDINDYAKPLSSKIEAHGGKIIKMMKRPFGVRYQLADAIYEITMNSRSYGYRLVK